MNQKTALDFLINRRSCGRLVEPSPNAEQLELMFRAASRGADHASLVPWRFIVLEGDDRAVLGDAMLASAIADNPQLELVRQEKIKAKPFRAPMVVIAISKNLEHPKVPFWEQELATAAAVQNMINAAYILGQGAYWRTGSAAFSDIVKQALEVESQEAIIGFVYLGAPKSDLPAPKSTDDWKQSVKFGFNNKT